MTIHIGIPDEQRLSIASRLSSLLADTFALYLRTHRFHWNVTGPMFDPLHRLFEQQYTELWTAVDVIAERIRVLGVKAPGSLSALSSLTALPEVDGEPKAMEMVALLLEGHQLLIARLRALMPLASKAGDESTLALLSERLLIHEKTAWMLRSILD